MTTISSTGKQALDELIAQTIAAKNTPGIVFGVSNLDEEIYFHGGGPNVVGGDPSSGEVGPDSIMWICSQTKLIAALAALKLVEQGKIAFDTPVADYLPVFRNPVIVDSTETQKTSFRPAKTVVTLKHLLTFTSGLFYPTKRDPTRLSEAYSSREIHRSEDPTSEFFRIIIGELPGLPLKFEPGTDFVYGWSSDALGFLVEKISGQTLEQFCKENIFDPLGMKTSFFLTPDLKERAVDLAYRDATNRTLHPWANQIETIEQDPTKVRAFFGGVGLYSSMRDYLKLLRHLMQIHAGRHVPNAIVKAETVHDIFVPVLPEKGVKSLSEFTMSEGISWSTALAVSTKDVTGRHRKGVAWWGGWAGTGFSMDPTTGIATVFGVQVAPTRDIEVSQAAIKLQNTLYKGLNIGI